MPVSWQPVLALEVSRLRAIYIYMDTDIDYDIDTVLVIKPAAGCHLPNPQLPCQLHCMSSLPFSKYQTTLPCDSIRCVCPESLEGSGTAAR